MARGLKSPRPTFDNRGMATSTPNHSREEPAPDTRPAVFKMSAFHPLAGMASRAGTAPDLRSHAAGLFPGSLTSGIGPEPGLLPTKPETAQAQTKPAAKPDPKARRAKTHAKTQAETKPAPGMANTRMTAEQARAFLMGDQAPKGEHAGGPRRTPPIPQSIRDLRLPGFTNAYELLPDEPRLFALESVYGRWDGQVLVLDSAPTHVNVVRNRLGRNTLRPYCQNETPFTYGLARLAFPLATRGVLAGSVFGPLLIDSNERDELIANRDLARKTVAPMLRFVVKSMPRLKAIVCLGATAYEYTLFALAGKRTPSHLLPSSPYDFDRLEPARPIFGGPTVFATCRTSVEAISRRGGETKAARDWQRVRDLLEHNERPRALHGIGRRKPSRITSAA